MKPTQPLRGKTVVMTGTLSVPRAEFAILIEDAGGVAVTSLSKSTDILIVGENPGAKLDEARANGTMIWTEEEARATMSGQRAGPYTAKLYGSSDDLVEAADKELNIGNGPIWVRFTNGTYAKIAYVESGIWRIDVLAAGRGKVRKLFGMPDDDDADCPQAHGDKDAPIYSDVLIISSEEPIEVDQYGEKPLKEPPAGLAKAKQVFKALEQFDGFESFSHELDPADYTAALEAVAKVIEGAVSKAMDDWMMS